MYAKLAGPLGRWCSSLRRPFRGPPQYPRHYESPEPKPLTADDVRQIIREELDRYKLPRKHGANMGPG